MKKTIPIKQILLEARAIDRRSDALSKGIIPINGSNWNADRNNPKKITNMLNLSKNARSLDGEITDRNNISPFKEYSGMVRGGNFILDRIGNRNNVESPQTFEDSFHKHPTISKQHPRFEAAKEYFQNKPIATPSGKNQKQYNMFSTHDYGVNSSIADLSPNRKKTEYIITPTTNSNTISKLDTTILPNGDARHKLSLVSGNAKKYYDLNGNIINDANGYNPTKKNLFFKDKDVKSKLDYLKTLKVSERNGFHNKALDINNPGFSGDKLLAQTYKSEGLRNLRKTQPALHDTNYLNDYNQSNDFSNAANKRYLNNNGINLHNKVIAGINNLHDISVHTNELRNQHIKGKRELEKEVLPNYEFVNKQPPKGYARYFIEKLKKKLKED